MEDRKKHWEDVYSRQASDAVSWYQRTPATSLSLIRASSAESAARVIDVGGGGSTLVDGLLALGYRNLTVLDLAGTALAVARRRLGAAAVAVEWVTADITSWRPAAPFDIWHDRAVFHFLTDVSARQGYVTALIKGLKLGGTAIIGTFALDGPERCSGLPVRRYSPETLTAELGSRFSLAETRHEDHITPGGKQQRFTWCRFVKVSE
ncbi:MAG TPA: class I SAM-dependent methyltransferase [Azospirillum sp.]